jgi:hypothetical protein
LAHQLSNPISPSPPPSPLNGEDVFIEKTSWKIYIFHSAICILQSAIYFSASSFFPGQRQEDLGAKGVELVLRIFKG